ncbi:hypothetical protein B0H10DRAFT_909371 [Mycena sp. CBHHK59/15]|nr:hypothetical protein B0H10DRAFT_909371 [Mycena sp. CBHHK59/15]
MSPYDLPLHSISSIANAADCSNDHSDRQAVARTEQRSYRPVFLPPRPCSSPIQLRVERALYSFVDANVDAPQNPISKQMCAVQKNLMALAKDVYGHRIHDDIGQTCKIIISVAAITDSVHYGKIERIARFYSQAHLHGEPTGSDSAVIEDVSIVFNDLSNTITLLGNQLNNLTTLLESADPVQRLLKIEMNLSNVIRGVCSIGSIVSGICGYVYPASVAITSGVSSILAGGIFLAGKSSSSPFDEH